VKVLLKLKKILDNFKKYAYELCIHALGCRVIQKVIECIPSDYLTEYIYNEIMDHIVTLTEDK